MFKNWKTSLAGLGAILTGIAAVVAGDYHTGIPSIIAGIGLLTAADAPKP